MPFFIVTPSPLGGQEQLGNLADYNTTRREQGTKRREQPNTAGRSAVRSARRCVVVPRPYSIYFIGFTGRPFTLTSKWTWGPVARPLEPTVAINSPWPTV